MKKIIRATNRALSYLQQHLNGYLDSANLIEEIALVAIEESPDVLVDKLNLNEAELDRIHEVLKKALGK